MGRVSQKYKLLGTLFIFGTACKNGPLISIPGASLSAGLPLSLLIASLLRGLTRPANPAGVFAPSTPINSGSYIHVLWQNKNKKIPLLL
jgi:hypothetical protein